MKTLLLKFNLLLFFVLLAWLLASCQHPAIYSDATGVYTHLKGKYYLKQGDSLTDKGYREYKLITEKRTTSTLNNYAAK